MVLFVLNVRESPTDNSPGRINHSVIDPQCNIPLFDLPVGLPRQLTCP